MPYKKFPVDVTLSVVYPTVNHQAGLVITNNLLNYDDMLGMRPIVAANKIATMTITFRDARCKLVLRSFAYSTDRNSKDGLFKSVFNMDRECWLFLYPCEISPVLHLFMVKRWIR